MSVAADRSKSADDCNQRKLKRKAAEAAWARRRAPRDMWLNRQVRRLEKEPEPDKPQINVDGVTPVFTMCR